MISDTGTINDKSFNQSAYEGATQAAAASGGKITAQFLPSSSPSDYAPNITTFINQKCGIIVTVGFLMGDATAAAAKANPSQKFAIVDFTYAKPFKNVSTLVYNTVEDGFQACYLAAGMSKTKKVATFGGQKLPTVTIYMDGFWDGVQYYNQKHHTNVQVLGWNEKTQNGTLHRQLHRHHGRPAAHATRSSARAPTSSSRSRATSASAPPRRCRTRTPRRAPRR